MKERQDETEQFIKKQFQKKAEVIDKEVQESCGNDELSDKVIEKIRAKVEQDIEQYEKEKVYAQLSEEDQKALDIGKKVQARRKKKKRKMYLSVAAVLVLVMAIGVTGVGGPERVVRIMKSLVGDREIMQVDSSEENAKSIEIKEEEAYQHVEEELGAEPIKIIIRPKNMEFLEFEYDKSIKTATLIYQINSEKIIYYINASYSKSSWGIDVEDNIISQWTKEVEGCQIAVKEYKIDESEERRYSATFEYKGLEYFLNGAMKRSDFDKIINNLYFY